MIKITDNNAGLFDNLNNLGASNTLACFQLTNFSFNNLPPHRYIIFLEHDHDHHGRILGSEQGKIYK